MINGNQQPEEKPFPDGMDKVLEAMGAQDHLDPTGNYLEIGIIRDFAKKSGIDDVAEHYGDLLPYQMVDHGIVLLPMDHFDRSRVQGHDLFFGNVEGICRKIFYEGVTLASGVMVGKNIADAAGLPYTENTEDRTFEQSFGGWRAGQSMLRNLQPVDKSPSGSTYQVLANFL